MDFTEINFWALPLSSSKVFLSIDQLTNTVCLQFLDYSDDEEERRARARTRGRDVSADDERTEEGTDDTMSQQGRKRKKQKKLGWGVLS